MPTITVKQLQKLMQQERFDVLGYDVVVTRGPAIIPIVGVSLNNQTKQMVFETQEAQSPTPEPSPSPGSDVKG